MAAERGDERLAPAADRPAAGRAAAGQATVAGAAVHGRWVGVCGELAGDPATAVLLAGLGVTELSMAPALVPEVKQALRGVDLARHRLRRGQRWRARQRDRGPRARGRVACEIS